MIAHKAQNPRIVGSTFVDNSAAQAILADSEHLVHRLVKKHLLPANLLEKQKAVCELASIDIRCDSSDEGARTIALC